MYALDFTLAICVVIIGCGDFLGGDAVIVVAGSREDRQRLVKPYFSRIKPAEDIILTRAGRPAITLQTAYAYDLQWPISTD